MHVLWKGSYFIRGLGGGNVGSQWTGNLKVFFDASVSGLGWVFEIVPGP